MAKAAPASIDRLVFKMVKMVWVSSPISPLSVFLIAERVSFPSQQNKAGCILRAVIASTGSPLIPSPPSSGFPAQVCALRTATPRPSVVVAAAEA